MGDSRKLDHEDNTAISESLDKLEVDGTIYRHGFGIIPKYVMIDQDLPLTAKALYALLCSYAGSGTITFPGRDTIVSTLGVNKDTYYKYLRLLINAGYISVIKKADGKGKDNFPHNYYRLESNPKKFQEDTRFQESERSGRLGYYGMKSAGFGQIARVVMKDTGLSIKARGLYAYFASLLGAGESAFPSIKQLCTQLLISKQTYRTLLDELMTKNYMARVQRIIRGRLGVNDYYIIENPSQPLPQDAQDPIGGPVDRPPAAKIDGENSVLYESTSVHQTHHGTKFSDTKISDTKISDTQKPDTQKPDTEISDTQISDTINNINTINNLFTIINPLYQQDSSPECGMIDGMNRKEKVEYIKETMGYEVLADSKYPNIQYIDALIEIVVDAISSRSPTRIKGIVRSREEVVEKLLALSYEDYVYVLDSVSKVTRRIKDIRRYYLSCLFFAKEDNEMQVKQELDMDDMT